MVGEHLVLRFEFTAKYGALKYAAPPRFKILSLGAKKKEALKNQRVF